MKPSALLPLAALGAILGLTNCATVAPPQPPSLDLPRPPQDLRATRKGNRVTLTWTVPGSTTDRQTIRSVGPTEICRNTVELKECGKPVGQAPPASGIKQAAGQKPGESFTDTLPGDLESNDPSGWMNYAVEVLNRAGRGAGLSNQVKVSLAPTLTPPQDFQARVTSVGVVLSWSPVAVPAGLPQSLHFAVRVYRREEGHPEQAVVGEIDIQNGSSLTDSDIHWEKSYEYHAETITLLREPDGSEAQLEGDDSATRRVFTSDIFPPAVPSGLQAVFSGPGQSPFVDLVWAPVTDADLAGYNVYRREEGTEPVKLNSEPVKTPAYRDSQVAAGKRYFYSVTSVDTRGNESAKSEEASEAVP